MTPNAATTRPTPVLEPEVTERPRFLPPYNVIIENDDHHTMEFVIEVLRKVFGFTPEKAFTLMMQAHESGCSVVWTGSKEVAELKAEQICTFHEKSHRTGKDLGPLGVRVEPAE